MAFKNLMGKAEKAAKPGEAPVETNREAASAPVPHTVAPATAIDANTQISGKLRCKETLRIDGRVKGEVRSDKFVIVGPQASLDASIIADSVVISGRVKGDIRAKRMITLEKTAHVTGELSTPGIVIEEGAKLEGRILIGSEDKAAASKQRAVPARGSAATSATPLS
ncbi:MAG: polymer-forming cytoskeletal protein [Myxococcota bacterium]